MNNKNNIFLKNKEDLKHFLYVERHLYGNAYKGWISFLIDHICSTPQSDQYYIWRYIKTLRFAEYYYNNSYKYCKTIKSLLNTIKYYWVMRRLRKYSYKTGIQISINSFDEGLQIYHYGTIIVNGNSHIGKNATILPGAVIGEKNGKTPTIGDNCYIGAGCKIIGGVMVGNNVTIAPNAVVVKDVPSDTIVAGVPAKIIKVKG